MEPVGSEDLAIQGLDLLLEEPHPLQRRQDAVGDTVELRQIGVDRQTRKRLGGEPQRGLAEVDLLVGPLGDLGESFAGGIGRREFGHRQSREVGVSMTAVRELPRRTTISAGTPTFRPSSEYV